MIKGHGDDFYQYEDIRMNFSSNVNQHVDHSALKNHLMERFDVIANYPEPEAWSLEAMIAERHGIDPRSVIVTNGATEAIYLVAQAFELNHISLSPCFTEYADAAEMFRRFTGRRYALWICNPNNPMGSVFSAERMLEWAKMYAMLVVDQSYEHYVDMPPLTPKQAVKARNIVQLHSFTKTYAVPGLRLGYIVATPRLTLRLRRFLRPWSVSALAVEAGKFLLAHDELRCQPCLDEAQRLRRRLQQIDGIKVLPTRTNFMVASIEGATAAQLKDYLASEHHILIRDASNFKGLTPDYFRVAAQAPEENDALVEAISAFVRQNH